MNLANKITVLRLVLVPVFVACVIAHASGGTELAPDLGWRIAAIAVFAVATLSDFLDGWIARRFQQKTLLGTTLDPIADKLLMLSAIFTLAVTPWNVAFPPWFVGLVFVRETIVLLGVAFMYCFLRRVEMGPHWISKTSTALQMACVVWILLDFRNAAPEFVWLVGVTALFMIVSTALYVREGLRQFAHAKTAALAPAIDVPPEGEDNPTAPSLLPIPIAESNDNGTT